MTALKVLRVIALVVGVLLVVGGIAAAVDVASGMRAEQTLSVELIIVGFALCAFGAGILPMTRFPDSTISAARIEIVDKEGKPRIVLEGGTSQPALRVVDRDGNSQIRLGLTESKPDLAMWETGGENLRIRICSLTDGTAGFVVCDANGRPRAFMTNLHDSAGLTLYNKDTKKRAELVSNNSGSYLSLSDDNELTRAEIYTGATWNLDAMEESFMKSAAADEETKRKVVPPLIEQLRDPSGLTFYDQKGVRRAE
jgi:hypothetical protein